MPEFPHHPASFRDPSGFIFQVKGIYYRQINPSYAADYERLLQSGLYAKLTGRKLLLAHQEVAGPADGAGIGEWDSPLPAESYKLLLPEQLELITYPYEWSFDQLRDAALHTLTVLRLSLEHDMILKDASPFNIQFREGKPLFIDTLSFERYDATLPWVAYRQFCESFLFPLYLEHYSGLGTQKTLIAWPDGIPATVTARLLPWKCRWKMGVWMHVYLPAMVEGRTVRGGRQVRQPGAPGAGGGQMRGDRSVGGSGTFSKQKLQHILQNLEELLHRLGTKGRDSTWRNYYEETILSRSYLEEKERLFREFIQGLTFRTALDIGANDGYFSHILGEAASVLAIDADAFCMNTLYCQLREKNSPSVLPLCVDVVNPTPAIGFRNRERASFPERVRVELVAALALVHHLVFGRNLPLSDIPPYFAELTTGYLLVEFVPLEDEKVQELIRNKSGYHLPYDEIYFEACFGQYFDIVKKQGIPGTKRVLYLMKKRPSSL